MASSRPGQAASVLFYFSLVLVAATSVAFGLDWMKAPLPPMPETEASVQAAKLAAHLPPPRKLAVAKPTPRSVYPTREQAPARAPGRAVAAVDATRQQPDAAPTAVPAAQAQPQCDVAACIAAYTSFRASDCTWQPFDGPRRFCDKGNPPPQQQQQQQQQQQAALEQGGVVQPSEFSDKCDIEACRHAFFTFDPTDCTYQPSDGPRRLCTKGTPPKPATAAAPAAATPPAAAPTAAAPAVSNKCDIAACKQAYLTFNPADCTYKPTLYGPRQLCTKGTPPKPEAKVEPAVPPPAVAAPPPAAPSAAPAAEAPPKSAPVKQQAAAPATAPPPAAEPPSAPVAAPPAAAPPAAVPPPKSEPAKHEANAPATVTPVPAPPLAPVASPPAAAPPAPPAAATPPAAPAVSDKCDVEACKRAYFTFNPADCTYQPSDGPRRLCSKHAPANSQAAVPHARRRAAPFHLLPPGLIPFGR